MNSRSFKQAIPLAGLVLLLTVPFTVVYAEDSAAGRGFGGPNAVPNQIESDIFETTLGRGIKAGESWDNWKAKLQKDRKLKDRLEHIENNILKGQA